MTDNPQKIIGQFVGIEKPDPQEEIISNPNHLEIFFQAYDLWHKATAKDTRSQALQEEAKKILSLVQSLYESGKDLVQWGRGLHELFRNLLLLQVGGGAESFIDRSEESKKELARFKAVFSKEELLLILSLFANLQADLRRALAPPKLLIETALLKLLHLEGLHTVKELVEKAESLSGGETSAVIARRDRSASSPGFQGQVPALFGPVPDLPSMKHSPPQLVSLNDIEQIWPQIVESVKAKEMSTGMFLAEAQPVEVTGETLIVGLPEEFQFHKEMLDRTEKRKFVEDALASFLKSPLRIQFVTTRVQKAEGAPSSGAGSEKEAPKLPEIVTKAMDIFQGSKIVRAE